MAKLHQLQLEKKRIEREKEKAQKEREKAEKAKQRAEKRFDDNREREATLFEQINKKENVGNNDEDDLMESMIETGNQKRRMG